MPEIIETTYHASGEVSKAVVGDTELIDVEVATRVAEQLGVGRMTRAQQDLATMKARAKGPSIIPIEIQGAPTYYVKRGSFPDLALAGTLSGRDEEAMLDIDNPEGLLSLIAGQLSVFVVNGPNDKTPYFESVVDARAFADDDAMAEIAARLFFESMELNPSIFPEGEGIVKKALEALRFEQSGAPTIPSSTLPPSSE